MTRTLSLLLAAGLGAAGALATTQTAAPAPASSLAPGSRCFELRTYTAPAGKLEALHARFRDHTNALFTKHGMTLVGYWVPSDADKGAGNTLVYMLSFPSREAAKKSWDDFRNDPEWQKVQKESEANGKLVAHVESVFVEPTEYSPMK